MPDTLQTGPLKGLACRKLSVVVTAASDPSRFQSNPIQSTSSSHQATINTIASSAYIDWPEARFGLFYQVFTS